MQERPVNGRRVSFSGDRQGANRRAAGAVSGGAAERPMEPKGVRASFCVFAENFTECHWATDGYVYFFELTHCKYE